MKNYIIILSSFMICVSCSQKPEKEKIYTQIAAQNKKLEEVVKTKNISLLDEVYDENAYFLAPDYKVVKGRDSIKKEWSKDINNIVEMHSKTLEITGENEVISEVGIVENTIKLKDTTFVYKAKFNNVWLRQKDGTYKLKVDIFNPLKE